MEDFRIEIVTGQGAGAGVRSRCRSERFTLVGATTRTGQLTSPLLSRFGIVERFDFYAAEELTSIVRRVGPNPRHPHRGRRRGGARPARTGHAPHRQSPSPPGARLRRGARRRPGYPRGRRLRPAQPGDRRPRARRRRFAALLSTVSPALRRAARVGIDALAAALAEDRDTLEYVYEPYLIQEGYLVRTPRGRQATRRVQRPRV